MSFLYEDEQNDLGQANYEKSYGSRLEKWYTQNYDRASSEGYAPENLAQDMYNKGKHREEGEDYDTWAKRHNVNRFVESTKLYDTQMRQQREDELTRATNLETMGDTTRGIVGGLHETAGALGGGGMMLLGKLAGGDNAVGKFLTTKGMDFYTDQMRQSSLYPVKELISSNEGQWISDDMQGAGDLADWAQGQFGKLLPTMALGLLSGGTGALVAGGTQIGGRAVAAPIMRGFVERQAKNLLSKGFVKATAGKSAEEVALAIAKRHVGGRAGAWIGTSMLETTGAFADTVQHLQQKFVEQGMRPEDALLQAHEQASGWLATGTGIMAGGIELMGGNIKILDKVLGKEASTAAQELINIARSSKATASIMGKALNTAKHLFLQAAKAAPAEFSQEAAQELLNILNVDFADPDFQMVSQETVKQALAAGAAGMVGGGVAAFGSASYDKVKGGSASQQVTQEAANLQRRIENQEAYIKANPSKAQEIQAALEKNRSELAKLTDHMDVEKRGMSYSDAVKQIQTQAPNINGKNFTTRALKKLAESPESPIKYLEDAQGKPIPGYIDPASVKAHIDMRKGQTPAAEVQPAAASPVVEEGVAPAASVMEDGRPEPPVDDSLPTMAEMEGANVEEEGSEVFDPEAKAGDREGNYLRPEDYDYIKTEAEKRGSNPNVVAQELWYSIEQDLAEVDILNKRIDSGKIERDSKEFIAATEQIETTRSVAEKLNQFINEHGIKDAKVGSRLNNLLSRGSLAVNLIDREQQETRGSVASKVLGDDFAKSSDAQLENKVSGYKKRMAKVKNQDGELYHMMGRELSHLEQILKKRKSSSDVRVEEEGSEVFDPNDNPRYVRNSITVPEGSAEAGLGRKFVEHAIFNQRSKLKNIAQVYEDVSELDETTQAAVRRSKGENEQAFYYKGKVYFNAKQIKTPDQLVHAMAHEVIHPAEEAHTKELSRQLGVESARAQWNKTIDHVYDSFRTEVNALYNEKYSQKNEDTGEYLIDMGSVQGRRKMVSEFLAEKHATDGGKDPKIKKWYERLATSLRQMFNGVRRALGMKPMKLNDEEVIGLIKQMMGSYDRATKAGEKFEGSGEPQFSRKEEALEKGERIKITFPEERIENTKPLKDADEDVDRSVVLKEKPNPVSTDRPAPVPSKKEKSPAEKIEDFVAKGFKEEVAVIDGAEVKTGKLLSKLSAEEKAHLTRLGQPENEVLSDQGADEKTEAEKREERKADAEKAERNRQSKVRRALISGGGMAGVGPVVSIETPTNPDFKHTLYDRFRVKLDYGFFENAKAYWNDWRERIHHDIHVRDDSMRRMPPVAKAIYEKMLVIERGLTIMSGKLSSETRAAFDATLAKIESEGAEAVDARVDMAKAQVIVEGLKQAVSERGRMSLQDFLAANPFLETMYRFAHFMRGSSMLRPGLTGEVASLGFRFREFEGKKLEKFYKDMGADGGGNLVETLLLFYDEILTHMTGIGALSAKEAEALALENNTLANYDFSSMPIGGDIEPGTSINFTRNALSNSILALGITDAFIPGRPLPVTTTLTEDSTELSEVLEKFHELKSKDPNLDALSDSEFVVGIIGMGQGRAALKSGEMDSRLANIYDLEKLPVELALKLEKAGFIKIQRYTENFKEYWSGYTANDKLSGVLGEIRSQTFMKDMDQKFNPRPGFYGGKQLSPSNKVLSDLRTVRPGSVLINQANNMFGVLGPIMQNGEFEILVPRMGQGGESILTAVTGADGKPRSFSKSMLADLGYVHVPSVWDFAQGRLIGEDMQAQNVFGWANAEAVVKSKEALLDASADTGLELRAMGHGRIVLDPAGNAYLALVGQSGEQALLEVVQHGKSHSAKMQDSMLRLYNAMRDAIGDLVGQDQAELSPAKMKQVRAKVRRVIDDLEAKRQVSPSEANELRSEMAALYKAVTKSLPAINEDQGPLLQRLYRALGKSGFLSSEASQEFLIMQEIMGATNEIAQDGQTVDGAEETQQEDSGFSSGSAIEMMSDIGFSETLRDLLGLNEQTSFVEAFERLKSRAANALKQYQAAKKEGLGEDVVGRMFRETKALFLAVRTIKKGNLMFATKAQDERVKTAAFKAAREVLNLRAESSDRAVSEMAMERMRKEVMNMQLPASWLSDTTSPLYAAASKQVRRFLKRYLFSKQGNVVGLASMLKGQQAFSLESISKTNHPNAKPLVLHMLSIISTMPSLGETSMLATNVAYFKALQDLPVKMKDGSTVAFSALSKADKDMVKSMMASGGLYNQLIGAMRSGLATVNEKGETVWGKDPDTWPELGTEAGNAMYQEAVNMKIVSTQSSLGIFAALDLPSSEAVDVKDLALRLGTVQIPADAGMMLEGMGPEDRATVYDYQEYRAGRTELFLQNSDSIYLRPIDFQNMLDDALLNDDAIVGSDEDGQAEWFAVDGIKYKVLTEESLAEEELNNKGVEMRLESGVITGSDYELLQHLKSINPSLFRFSGGRISRDGRSPLLNINGTLYPIDYKDRSMSDFGWSLLQVFKRLHDEAWQNDAISEYERVRIREQMLAWEDFARQHSRERESELRRQGGFRTAKTDPKHTLSSMNPDEEARFKRNMTIEIQKVIATIVSIPSGERPSVVVHGLNETAADLLNTVEGRMAMPDHILASLSAKGGAKKVMSDLRRAMGFVDKSGVIHIFPRMHADAAGNIDKVELTRTVFHEAVGHVALERILGPEYREFAISVFRKHVDPEKKLSFTDDMKVLAAEEYMAGLADKISYNTDAQRLTNANVGTILDRVAAMIMRAFRRVMQKLGHKVEISKVEVRELLGRAFAGTEVKASGVGIIGPAMIPAENLGTYEAFRDYQPNLADRFLRNVADKLRYWELLFRSKESDRTRIADENHFMYGLRTLNSRVGYLTEVAAKLEDKFIKSFAGKGYDQKAVAEIVLALHTIERNEQDADRYLEMLPEYLRKKGAVTPSPEEAARGITEDDKIAQAVQSAKRRMAKGQFNKSTGFTTEWAKKRLSAAAAAGLYRNGEGSAADSIKILLDASKMSLAIAEEAGMISHEEAAKFREKYEYFVPIPRSGSFGFGDVNGFKLQGRSRFASEFDSGLSQQSAETPDVIAYTFANLRHRIVEGETNKTNQYIADFAMANPNAGVFTVYLHPEEVRWYTDTNGVEQYDIPKGFAQMGGPITAPGTLPTQDQLREYEQRLGVMPVYQNGKLRYVRIEHEGLRKSYDRMMNPTKQGFLMKQLGKVNRMLIAVNTMLNPEFLIPNLFRDAGAAMNTLSIQGTVAGISGKTGVDFTKEFAPRIRHAMKVLHAQNFGKGFDSLTGEAKVIAGYIEEFQRSGGKIQWPYMESAAETMKNLEEAIAVIQGKATLAMRSKAFGSAAVGFMKKAADVFENATRLSAYVTARENGVSMQRAALLSRDLTVDFDRKGDVGQVLNTLYLFANAGLQGTLVIARAIKNNPQRAAKHLGAFVSLSFSLALANILMGGDDDDGEPSYFAVPEETRNGNLVLMVPFSDGVPLRIPLPYGYAFFWSIGQEMANAVFGRGGTGKAAAGIMGSLLNNFNPLESAAGLSDAHGWTRLFTPTVVDPFVDVFFEQTAFGTPLMPEKTFEQQPDSTRHWRSVSTTSKEAARMLNELFGGSGGKSSGLTDISPETLDLAYETVTGGLGKFLGRTTQLLMAPVSGREVGPNDLPVLRRFVGGKLNWEDRGRFKDNYAEIQGANRTFKNLKDNVNMAQTPELKAQATRDRDDFFIQNKHLLNMRREANQIVSRVGDIDKQKERLYKSGLPETKIAPALKALDDRQRKIFSTFNEKYYRIIDSQ